MRVLITGASGFIGRGLCGRALSQGWHVRGTLLASENPSSLLPNVEPLLIDPLGPHTEWFQALSYVDTVIHLAARVHIMHDTSADPLKEFRLVNTLGTERLALEAARAGVKRFVFVSSIKVNGEESPVPYRESDTPSPADPYGVSKWDAELALRRIELESGLEVVVVRPTLVYGPGVKANFLGMMSIVQRGIPLPFAAIDNSRSMIYIGNLVDALVTCASHPKAAGGTYLVSDGEDVSTPELIRRTAAALGVPARMMPLPPALIRLAGALTGKSAAVKRLLGSLTVDSSKIREELGWTPPYTMAQGLNATADWYLKRLND